MPVYFAFDLLSACLVDRDARRVCGHAARMPRTLFACSAYRGLAGQRLFGSSIRRPGLERGCASSLPVPRARGLLLQLRSQTPPLDSTCPYRGSAAAERRARAVPMHGCAHMQNAENAEEGSSWAGSTSHRAVRPRAPRRWPCSPTLAVRPLPRWQVRARRARRRLVGCVCATFRREARGAGLPALCASAGSELPAGQNRRIGKCGEACFSGVPASCRASPERHGSRRCSLAALRRPSAPVDG
jgi:hypothetical protein